jgi:hypothetical protein
VSDALALIVALAANVVAMVAVVIMWRRGRRRRRAVRSRHPSSRPPVSIRTADTSFGRRFRIDIARSAPTTAIDIVSFQRVGFGGEGWVSEPLVTPLVIEPGGYAVLWSELPENAYEFNVVVAWTAQHPTGDVQGSMLFRLPQEGGSRGLVRGGPSLRLIPAVLLLALLIVSFMLVASHLINAIGDDDDSQPTTPPTSVEPAGSIAPPVTTGATDTTPTTRPTEATSPVAVAPTTARTAPQTTTTAPPPTSTSLAVAVSSTSLASDGPRVLASARLGVCRFGTDCLLISFTIDGFEVRPQEYICEFDDGSRFTFRFDSTGVDEACSSGSVNAAITVEVGGVRSATLTRADI